MPHVFHSPAYKEFLAILIDARKRRGMTQTDLGKRIGRRQTFVSKIEQGERRVDLVEFLILADILGLDVDEVLTTIRGAIRSRTI